MVTNIHSSVRLILRLYLFHMKHWHCTMHKSTQGGNGNERRNSKRMCNSKKFKSPSDRDDATHIYPNALPSILQRRASKSHLTILLQLTQPHPSPYPCILHFCTQFCCPFAVECRIPWCDQSSSHAHSSIIEPYRALLCIFFFHFLSFFFPPSSPSIVYLPFLLLPDVCVSP